MTRHTVSEARKDFSEAPNRVASGGFSRQEIRRLQRLVEENAQALLRSWNEFFAS